MQEYIKRHPELGLLAHALPQVVQDSIKVLTLSPAPTATANHIPASNIDINVSNFLHLSSSHLGLSLMRAQ